MVQTSRAESSSRAGVRREAGEPGARNSHAGFCRGRVAQVARRLGEGTGPKGPAYSEAPLRLNRETSLLPTPPYPDPNEPTSEVCNQCPKVQFATNR